MKRVIGLLLCTTILMIGLMACGSDKRFEENKALKQPLGIIDCKLIDTREKEKTVTYVFSLGEDKSQTKALEMTGAYLDEIKKDGFTTVDGSEPGYYAIMDGDKLAATMGINPIEDNGVCLIFVLDK